MSCDVRSCDVPCNGHVVWSKWFCDNVVIQSTILCYKVLLCTTKYYSSTTLYYNVLLQYYSVLQSTTTYYSSTTLYYSSTTLYCKVLLLCYKVLLQYYSVLQSATPVLLCTTKYYYSSTTLYYKVLLQYYSVLQRTTPVLLCTTKNYSSTTLYYTTTLYYKVQLQYYSVLQSTTPVLLCTTNVTGQVHQILRLPRKMNPMINPRHTWNIIYNARSNKSHPPTSPNTAPATQNESHDWSASQMKRHLQCAEQQESPCNFSKYCACHAKWFSWLIRITYETSFTMRGATRVSLQLHQILRLPRKMNLMIDPRHIWNVIYNARSKQSHPITSPNIASATKSSSSRLHWKLSELLPPI